MLFKHTQTDMERKCSKCKHSISLDNFRTKWNWQPTKQCIKCLDNTKVSQGRTKCPHGRQSSKCKPCGGVSICAHQKIRSTCKKCGGSQISKHNKRRSTCLGCEGGSICGHGTIRSTCRECEGGSICKHQKQRRTCRMCDPSGHLASIISRRTHHDLQGKQGA